MKRLLTIILSTSCLYVSVEASAVTYEFNEGRFGDQAITYLHARWVAYKYSMPLIYKEFDLAYRLMVDSMHLKEWSNHDAVVNIPQQKGRVDLDTIINAAEKNLYVVQYFPESLDQKTNMQYGYFDIDWNDKAFTDILKQEFAPNFSVRDLNLPEDRITVAVHMRRGGGFDKLLQDVEVRDPKTFYDDVHLPLKFPPNEYYIDQIIRISELLDNKPIYVQIFTDEQNPLVFIEKIKAGINKPNIVFGFRDKDVTRNTNTIEDFLALTKFDCLIRADSNFSLMASKLGDYKIQIHPTNHRWEGTKLIITEVHIEQKAADEKS